MARVVIGEDDPDLCTAMKMIFQRAGHQVCVAADGLTTLETARRWRPGLLVLDVAIPGMSGLEVCRVPRADAGTAHLPILIVSASAFPGDLDAGRAAGADDYLAKPFANAELLARATTLLRRCR